MKGCCSSNKPNFLFQFATTEDEKLLQYADNWEKTLNAKFSDREYKTTVIDVNGKTVFVTRYFKALEPPPDIFGSSDTEVKKMVRFKYYSLLYFHVKCQNLIG